MTVVILHFGLDIKYIIARRMLIIHTHIYIYIYIYVYIIKNIFANEIKNKYLIIIGEITLYPPKVSTHF
jgi:hypothetical protein